MKILGFSVGHDKGAVIIEDGKVLIGITQERLSRIKHDGAYSEGKIPFESINYCLNGISISYKDIDLWVYSTTEIVDETNSQFFAMYPDLDESILKFIPHHLAHAFSSFYSSGFDEACVVVADASGSIISYKNQTHKWYPPENFGLSGYSDWAESVSIYNFTREGYEEVHKKWMEFPIKAGEDSNVSLGTIYSNGSLQLIFEPDSKTWPAGKLMGLASFANPDIVAEAPEFVKEVDGDIFFPNIPIYPKVTWQSDFYSRACVAGIYQREQERASIILANIAKRLTNSKNICVAGGSFLNCNSNELIQKSGLFEKSFFVPPADDSGIPLGCAWFGTYISDVKIEPKIIQPYFGKSYNKESVISALNDNPGVKFFEYENFDELIERVGFWLTQNRVIGWFQDGSEIGPRALGNRSIIASPTQPWMTSHINMDIKGREWYRPFAPAVLYEFQNEIFESDVYSPHMLVTTKVREEWKDKIPAVVHIDGSSRHQSVTPSNNPKFYSIIKQFHSVTGVPVLLNTSFNGPGEPIVETPHDAIKTFLQRKLDLVVINNFLISITDL